MIILANEANITTNIIANDAALANFQTLTRIGVTVLRFIVTAINHRAVIGIRARSLRILTNEFGLATIRTANLAILTTLTIARRAAIFTHIPAFSHDTVTCLSFPAALIVTRILTGLANAAVAIIRRYACFGAGIRVVAAVAIAAVAIAAVAIAAVAVAAIAVAAVAVAA